MANWTARNNTPCSCQNLTSNQSCCHWYVFSSELEFLPPPLSSEMLALLTSLYALVVVGALLANVLVTVVVVKARMLRSFTDMFILSLAVSDLLVAGFNMPVRLLSEVWNEWRLGLAACRLTEYLQGVTIVNNIFTLTAIAIDRYLVICLEQVRRRINGRKWTLIGLLAVWVVSLLAVVPQLVMTKLDMRIKRDATTHEITGRAWVCAEVLSDRERRVYTLSIYTCVYVLPMCVIGFTYGSIAKRLWRRERRAMIHGEAAAVAAAANNQRLYPQSQIALARRRRVTAMMVTLVLAFTLLWLPFFSASLYLEFRGLRSEAGFRAARDFLQLVGYSTCFLNPIIYTFFNRNFQDQLCALCCRPAQRALVAPAPDPAPGPRAASPAPQPSPLLPQICLLETTPSSSSSVVNVVKMRREAGDGKEGETKLQILTQGDTGKRSASAASADTAAAQPRAGGQRVLPLSGK